MTIKISLRHVARFLVIVGLGLLALSLIASMLRYVLGYDSVLIKWFLLGEEENIPTFYSSMLFLAGAGLALIAATYRARPRQKYAAHWAILALVFLYCSVDEMIEIHERLIKPLRSILHTRGLLYFAWVIPFGGLVLLFVLAYAGFLKELPPRSRALFITAGFVYVLGAIGVEMLGGRYYFLHPGRSFAYSMYQTVEETLEITGLSLFFYALCDYLRGLMKSVTFELDKS